MKVYGSTRQLLADVERLLAANRPGARHSPLQDVIDLLCRGRHYSWAGIFVAVAGGEARMPVSAVDEVVLPETRSKILVSLKLASRDLGVLSVESDGDNALGAEDRILLEGVADALALFLAGRGKYLVRKARLGRTENWEPGTNN